MQEKSVLQKIFITILTFGIILWFGGSIIRSSIAFDLFIPAAKMELKPGYSDGIRLHSVYIYTVTGTYSTVGYIAAFISAIVLYIHWRKVMKVRGWLFMAFVLFFISSPVELYLCFTDIKLSLAFQFNQVGSFSDSNIQKFFLDRYKNIALTTASGLSFLAVITSLLYIVWHPLDMLHTQYSGGTINEK